MWMKWGRLIQGVLGLGWRMKHKSSGSSSSRGWRMKHKRRRSSSSSRGVDPSSMRYATIKHMLAVLDETDGRADVETFASLLRECQSVRALAEGKRVHAHIIKGGLQTNRYLGNLLIMLYGSSGRLNDAWSVFEAMRDRNVVSWNALISAYVRHGDSGKAIQLFHQMQEQGLKPDKINFVTILSACSGPDHLPEGKLIHAQIVESEFDSDVFVATALLSMYGKCSSLGDAFRVFRKMPRRNVVTWNAMIAACALHNEETQAMRLFQQMQEQGFKPNKNTFISILNASCSLGFGRAVHAHISSSGFNACTSVANALITMYSRCCSLDEARWAFDGMGKRDVVSWTAMISAYVQHGHSKQALQLFQLMQRVGERPAIPTLVSVLEACAHLAALTEGKLIHALIVDLGYKDVLLGTALVSMYGKCGSLPYAIEVFEKMPERDAVAWTAMIAIYAQHGRIKVALQHFGQMQAEGLKPDEITFISVLSSCSHAGWLDEGSHYFDTVSEDRGFLLSTEHHRCIVDLFSRAGRLNEAEGCCETYSI